MKCYVPVLVWPKTRRSEVTMGVLRQGLRQLIDAWDTGRFIKFLLYKLPIAGISVLSLWAMRQFMQMLWAGWINSLMFQIIEFWVLRAYVFNANGHGKQATAAQFALFWIWACTIAAYEGYAMRELEVREWHFLALFAVVHIPTPFLRFFGDQIIFSLKNTARKPADSES